MGDWALSTCERVESSSATASRGAANGKGAYAQLIAATGFPYTSVTLQAVASGGGGQTYLIDLAVGGAGSEQVIAPNMLLDSARSIFSAAVNITIPVAIPAGVRVSARVQEVGGAGTRTVEVTVLGRNGGINAPPASIGDAVNYGANTGTTNGVLVDAGATLNTYGSWTDITASTSRAHNALQIMLGTNQQTGVLVDSQYYFQLGIGSTGNAVAANLGEFLSGTDGSINRMLIADALFSQQIPAGTRVAMRSKCVVSGATGARQTTAIILGY